MIIKKVGVLSLAINSAVIGAIGGLIAALFFLLFGSAFMAMMQSAASQVGDAPNAAALGAGFGMFGLVVFPIMYAVFGFIGGAIYALIFNLAARLTGGLQLETS